MAERRASGALEEMQNLPSVIICVSDFSLAKGKEDKYNFSGLAGTKHTIRSMYSLRIFYNTSFNCTS